MNNRVWFASIIILALAAWSRAEDDIDPKAKAVCEKWKERQDTLPAVRYRYTVESWIAPIKQLQQEELKFTSEWVVSIDSKSGRYRFESVSPEDGGWKKKINVYNGKELQTIYFKADQEGNPLPSEKLEVFIGRGDYSSMPPFESGFEQPLLISHGIVSTSKNAFAQIGKIHFMPDCTDLFHHGSLNKSGKALDVFRTYPQTTNRTYKEIEVDTKRNSIVLENRVKSEKINRLINSTKLDYKLIEGFDILHSHSYESFSDIRCHLRHKSNDIQVEIMNDPPELDYNLKIEEGQVVTLQQYGKGTELQVPKVTNSSTQYREGDLVPIVIDPDGTIHTDRRYLYWLLPSLLFGMVCSGLLVRRFVKKSRAMIANQTASKPPFGE